MTEPELVHTGCGQQVEVRSQDDPDFAGVSITVYTCPLHGDVAEVARPEEE